MNEQTNIVNQQKRVKHHPNWQGADQLTIYKAWGSIKLSLGPTKTNPYPVAGNEIRTRDLRGSVREL